MEDDIKTPICRVCIDEIECTDKCYYIFQKYEDILSPDKNYDDTLIVDKINALAKVEISEGDGLPNNICSSCLLELEDAYNFKRKCEKSDDILRIAGRGCQDHYVPVKVEGGNELDHDYSDEDELLSNIQQSSDDKIETPPIEDIKIKSETGLPNIIKVPNKPKTESTYIKCEDKKCKVNDVKLECHDCGDFFKSKCKLRVHWKKHHYYFSCNNCKKQFRTNRGLQFHQKTKPRSCIYASKMRIEGDGKTQVWHCMECNFSTKTRMSLLQHFLTHSDKRFVCDLCTKSFKKKQTLKAHKERVHKQNFGQRACHICGQVIGINSFDKHMKKHRDKLVQCDTCNKVLSSKTSLLMHLKRHSGVKGYACSKCDCTFYTPSELHFHNNKKHDPRPKKTHYCKFCGYGLKNRYLIIRHEKKHNPANIGCKECGKFVDNEVQLTLHMKRHTNRSHKCDYCIKTFYGRDTLTNHLRVTHEVYISRDQTTKIDKTRIIKKLPRNKTKNVMYEAKQDKHK